jgi:hypothetical protein
MWLGLAINEGLVIPEHVAHALIGTPRYLRVRCKRSTIWLMHVLAEMNLLPYHVAILMVACFLEYQLIGILFMKCRIPVME